MCTPFVLSSMLTGIIETEVPESATHISYLFVDLPSTLFFISGDTLFFLSLEILALLMLSTSGLVGVGKLGLGDVVTGGFSQKSLHSVPFLSPGKGFLSLAPSFL